MKQVPDVTVVMPALNEEANIGAALDATLGAFTRFGLDGEVIVVNDGSTDGTGAIVRDRMAGNPRIRTIVHRTPMGIGASFWEGVDAAAAPIVVLLPGDNETYPEEILRYFPLLDHVDMVVPWVFNKEVRPPLRNLLSNLYKMIINATFFVFFNYTNGTVMYRRSVLLDLDKRSRGFFYQADILIRAARQGYLFAEVPYRLGLRREGRSTAVSMKALRAVGIEYLVLLKDFAMGRIRRKKEFPSGTASAVRYGEHK